MTFEVRVIGPRNFQDRSGLLHLRQGGLKPGIAISEL